MARPEVFCSGSTWCSSGGSGDVTQQWMPGSAHAAVLDVTAPADEISLLWQACHLS
jgi:hypothetical protein